jgi:hypothetical protein
MGTHQTVGDPRYMDVAQSDYRLLPTSPAWGTGMVLQCVPADIDGLAFGSGPRNRGCYRDAAEMLVAAACEDAWVYQNAPQTTGGAHWTALDVGILADPTGSINYSVEVVPSGPLSAAVTVGATDDPLVWAISGGRSGVDPVGKVTLNVTVIGDDENAGGFTTAQIEVRKLGDINGDGKVNALDKALLVKRLNGLAVTQADRAFDLNGDGELDQDDMAVMNALLNGLKLP